MRKIRRNFFISIGQMILVAIILIFVGYRVALLLDLVPEDFSPSGVVKEEFVKFKAHLQQDAQTDDLTAPVSEFVLHTMKKMEDSYAKRKAQEAAEAAVEQRCGENNIFRFFMYLGSDKSKPLTCTTSNLKLHEAVKDINKKDPAPAATRGSNSGPMLSPPGTVYVPTNTPNNTTAPAATPNPNSPAMGGGPGH